MGREPLFLLFPLFSGIWAGSIFNHKLNFTISTDSANVSRKDGAHAVMALSLTARASGANTTSANAATVNRRSAILTTTTVLTATLKAKPARGRAKLPPPGKTDVKSVLIVGATGCVGREVVRCVLDSKEKGQMKLVRAAARNFDDDYKAMQGNVQLVALDVVRSPRQWMELTPSCVPLAYTSRRQRKCREREWTRHIWWTI